MDYSKQYSNLVQKAKLRTDTLEYYEIHHILPRALGGTDEPDNLVTLSLREHFVAHLLLAKIHGGKMWYAARRMSCYKKYTNRTYDWVKRRFYDGFFIDSMKGRKRSPESRKRMSDSQKRLYENGYKGSRYGKKCSIEEIYRMSETTRNFWESNKAEEARKHLSRLNSGKNNPNYGKRRNERESEKQLKGIRKFFDSDDGSRAKEIMRQKSYRRQKIKRVLGLGRNYKIPTNSEEILLSMGIELEKIPDSTYKQKPRSLRNSS